MFRWIHFISKADLTLLRDNANLLIRRDELGRQEEKEDKTAYGGEKDMYANKSELSRLFDVSRATVYRRVQGIEKLIGDRYNAYAILENLVSVAVFADYSKYHTRLEDKNMKKYVPPFNIKEAGAYIFVDLGKGINVL